MARALKVELTDLGADARLGDVDLGGRADEAGLLSDAEGLAALYEPDAVLAFLPGQETVGRDAIRKVMEQMLEHAPKSTVEEPLPTLIRGDIALTSMRPSDNTGDGSRLAHAGGAPLRHLPNDLRISAGLQPRGGRLTIQLGMWADEPRRDGVRRFDDPVECGQDIWKDRVRTAGVRELEGRKGPAPRLHGQAEQATTLHEVVHRLASLNP